MRNGARESSKVKKFILKMLLCSLLFSAGIVIGGIIFREEGTADPGGATGTDPNVQYDETAVSEWDPDFMIVRIESTMDGNFENAYFHGAVSGTPQPLVVSLHTWSGDYTQHDPLALLCKSEDLNYIHPNFRGPNWTIEACCSELAINDIDDSITYALENGNVDPSRIYVIGVSGGGYATLAMFMKSRHKIRKFSAWVPISDLSAWYEESLIRGNRYSNDILACTGSGEKGLDRKQSELRSPLHWETRPNRLGESELAIHAGVYDGIQGSVPITHSINFYNKVLADLYPGGSKSAVSEIEKAKLLEFRKPLGDFGIIGGREICLEKSHGNLRLIIFTGNHEILPEAALGNLIGD